jgi:hypothetical protein
MLNINKLGSARDPPSTRVSSTGREMVSTLFDSELTDPGFRTDEHEVGIARQDVQPDRSIVEPGFQVDERLAVPSTDDGTTPLVSEPSTETSRPRGPRSLR